MLNSPLAGDHKRLLLEGAAQRNSQGRAGEKRRWLSRQVLHTSGALPCLARASRQQNVTILTSCTERKDIGTVWDVPRGFDALGMVG